MLDAAALAAVVVGARVLAAEGAAEGIGGEPDGEEDLDAGRDLEVCCLVLEAGIACASEPPVGVGPEDDDEPVPVVVSSLLPDGRAHSGGDPAPE